MDWLAIWIALVIALALHSGDRVVEVFRAEHGSDDDRISPVGHAILAGAVATIPATALVAPFVVLSLLL